MKNPQQGTVIAHSNAFGAPADLQKIGHYMAKLNVRGLPRNYQLFHEALYGADRAMATDIAALGNQPSQAMLDEIGLKYRLVSHCGLVAQKSQADAAHMLRDVADQLAEGLRRKQTFVEAIETVSNSVKEQQDAAVFTAEMDFLNASLSNLMLYETELTEKLKSEAEKLDVLEKSNAAMRASTATDRVTGLPNQLAIINHLTDLFEAGATQRMALIMVDIDDFRAFNGRYGPQVANQLLKKLGAVFRKSVKKNDFVARMSGDDFCFLFTDVSTEDARAIATRLRISVEETLVYATSDKKDPGRLTISAGISMSSDAETATELMVHAELALNAAQANRRQPIQVFTIDKRR